MKTCHRLLASLLAALRSFRHGLAVLVGLIVILPAYLVVLLLWRLLCCEVQESEAGNWSAGLDEDIEA